MRVEPYVGDAVDTRPERYEFNWVGKRDAIAMLQAPTRATLVPDHDASVDFDSAQHAFIEGENLEVLKVLWQLPSARHRGFLVSGRQRPPAYERSP